MIESFISVLLELADEHETHAKRLEAEAARILGEVRSFDPLPRRADWLIEQARRQRILADACRTTAKHVHF